MIYPRLLLSKSLLRDDGVIFISIDDHESANLIKICDEVFGDQNRVSLICHKSRASVSNDKIISTNHNLILFYAKDIRELEKKRSSIGLDPTLDGFNYDDNDGKGSYRLTPVDGPGGAKKGNPFYEFLGIEGYWRFSKETMNEKYQSGLIVKKANSLYQKYYKSDAIEARKTATTWWDDVGLMSTATSRLKSLMGGASFDTPKPVELIDRMLRMITNDDPDAIIMDFFAGSSTTADAVMKYNSENNGRRQFILIQLPEKVNEKSEAYQNGYRLITEIGKKRIKIVGDQVKEKNENIDVGFRVFRCDSSNMKDSYYYPDGINRNTLDDYTDNIKEDRSPEDLLIQVMLELGIELSSKIGQKNMHGHTIYSVDGGYLVACFDDSIDDSIIVDISKEMSGCMYAIFRSGSSMTDEMLANIEQIFKTHSPQTKIRIL